MNYIDYVQLACQQINSATNSNNVGDVIERDAAIIQAIESLNQAIGRAPNAESKQKTKR